MPVCRPVILSVCLLVVRLLVGQSGCPSVCQSVYPLVFPSVFPLGLSTCPPNGQTDLPPLSPPVVCHHNRLSVCLCINSLIGQAGCPSVSQCLCAFLCLPGGPSVLPFSLPIHPPCSSHASFFSVCGAGFTHHQNPPLSAMDQGWLPPAKQSRLAGPPRSPSSPPAPVPPHPTSTAEPLPSVGIHPLSPALECYRKI